MKAKEQKTIRVIDKVPVNKRAFGVKLPHGNFTLVAKADVTLEKLPTQLRATFAKIQAKGKDGGRMDTLFPRDAKTGKAPYERFLVRILLKKEAIRVVPAEKKITVTKKLSIANAVKKANNKLAKVA